MYLLKNTAKKVIKFIRFFGFKYSCPLCHKNARVFTPNKKCPGQKIVNKYKISSMGERLHYRCPWCNSSDKERMVWLYLKKEIGILDNTKYRRILHVAPEKNTRKILSNRFGTRYLSGDMFEGDKRYTKERYGNSVYIDITDMKDFNDESFDYVICNHVLEHVPDDILGMSEIYRVLKKGGIAILNVPVSKTLSEIIENDIIQNPEDRVSAFGQADHVRIYNERGYLNRLASVGFIPKAIRQSEYLDTNEIKKSGLNLEKIFVALK